jgi:nitrile hydratase
MVDKVFQRRGAALGIVTAAGEVAPFMPGDRIRVKHRVPIGHYRVPQYLRDKVGVVQSIVEPSAVDNEEEGYGRNAGSRLHYYNVAFPLCEIWPGYGTGLDRLQVDVFETWLEKIQ